MPCRQRGHAPGPGLDLPLATLRRWVTRQACQQFGGDRVVRCRTQHWQLARPKQSSRSEEVFDEGAGRSLCAQAMKRHQITTIMRRRYVICLMLVLIASPEPLNGSTSSDSHVSTTYTPTSRPTTAVNHVDEKSRQLDDVLSSLDAAFHFMTTEAANMNLDAIIGTRMVQGRSVNRSLLWFLR